jgi:hypothetical protein
MSFMTREGKKSSKWTFSWDSFLFRQLPSFHFSFLFPLPVAGTNKNIKFNGQNGEDDASIDEEEKHFNGIGSSG